MPKHTPAEKRKNKAAAKETARRAKVAEIVCGGPDPIADKGFFIAPTLLVATDPRAAQIHR